MAAAAPTHSEVAEPSQRVPDDNTIPQRHHVCPTSERPQRIVKESMTMDSRLSRIWPIPLSSPKPWELHDVVLVDHPLAWRARSIG